MLGSVLCKLSWIGQRKKAKQRYKSSIKDWNERYLKKDLKKKTQAMLDTST